METAVARELGRVTASAALEKPAKSKKSKKDKKTPNAQAAAAAGCAAPGSKIRSGGAGRGLSIGRGKGPIGRPALNLSDDDIEDNVEAATDAGCEVPGSRTRSGGAGRGLARGRGRGPIGRGGNGLFGRGGRRKVAYDIGQAVAATLEKLAKSKKSKKVKKTPNAQAAADAGCPAPGSKIRSKGTGRGLSIGRGKGPIGRPALNISDEDVEDNMEAAADAGCPAAGSMIRSKGMGRGLARGRGRGPIGRGGRFKTAHELGRATALEKLGVGPVVNLGPSIGNADVKANMNAAAAAGCETPGSKINSRGLGRGLAIGQGKGPIGRGGTTKVAFEVGRAVAQDRLVKEAGDVLVGRVARVAVTLAKRAGLNDAAIDDMVDRINFEKLIEKAAQYQHYNLYNPYGMPGMQYGGEDRRDPQNQSLVPGMTMAQLMKDNNWIFREKGAPWFESGVARAARRTKQYYEGLGQKVPDYAKDRGRGSGTGGGAGGGSDLLHSRGAQRMGARSGINMADWGKEEGYMADLLRGDALRQARSRQWRQLANSSAKTWGGKM